MKLRHVYSTPDLATAQDALVAARQAGILNDDLSLVARSDIELQSIPNDRKEADTDMLPAAMRGAGLGGAAGLAAGLLAVVVTPIGLTLAGAAAATVAGAAIGTWASALAGSALPDPVRAQFDDEIKAGRILVVIDGESGILDDADVAMIRAGATRLQFEQATQMT